MFFEKKRQNGVKVLQQWAQKVGGSKAHQSTKIYSSAVLHDYFKICKIDRKGMNRFHINNRISNSKTALYKHHNSQTE